MTTAWNAESYTQKNFLENFVKLVAEETQGKLEIRIFPDYQLPKSNGTNKSKEEVNMALTANEVQIVHSGPHINFKDNPEAIFFSTIPFGMNYTQMVNWMKRPKIKSTLLHLYEKKNILTFQGGHSGVQYGGWYMEMPKDSNFFRNKNVRFANFAGYLLSHPSVGAKQKSMLRYQFNKLIDHIKFDVVEWQNPEEDVSIGMHLKGFPFYDRSSWNEPNAMYAFYINKTAFNNLSKNLKNSLTAVLEKVGEQKIFSEDNHARQLAENTIENTTVKSSNVKIKIFDLQKDVPQLYQFLYHKNQELLNDFVEKNKSIRWLYEDYKKELATNN
jgi:TRAP-type mannitol/chloroaromatic compound transport system substrate-binding protein